MNTSVTPKMEEEEKDLRERLNSESSSLSELFDNIDGKNFFGRDDDELDEEYIFQVATKTGTNFVKIDPEEEMLMFEKSEYTMNYETRCYIENITEDALLAFHITYSGILKDWTIQPDKGFIVPGRKELITITAPKDEAVEELEGKLIFIKTLPLHEFQFVTEKISIYDAKCWRRCNVNVLFTTAVMHTEVNDEIAIEIEEKRRRWFQIEEQKEIERRQREAMLMESQKINSYSINRGKFDSDDLGEPLLPKPRPNQAPREPANDGCCRIL